MTISKTNTKFAKQATHLSPMNLINTPVMSRCLLSVAVASALLLAGCGDDNDTPNTSINAPQSIATFTPSQIDQELLEASTIGKAITPAAKCGVTVEKIRYQTKGAANESTNATAALMIPSGDTAECQGARPILLYAHETTTEQKFDFTQVGNAQNPAEIEATMIAANFAAQGYIVVAPNYAGYDSSDLNYHPYLNAKQQSTEMVTALDTARAAINQQKNANNAKYTKVNDSGKLFLSGYSQGGHVTMATARLLEQQNKPITAIAPSSGPYALAAFGDAIFTGNVSIGSTAFAPLLATSLQKANNKIYNNPTEIFADNYANTQLPNALGFEDLVIAGKLPLTALFQAEPTNHPILNNLPVSPLPFAVVGFDSRNYLIQTDFRAAYVIDALQNPDDLLAQNGRAFPALNPKNELRKTLKVNDLRGYVPKIPTLLCGGNQDPSVFYDLNTSSMTKILQGANAQNPAAQINVTVLDVDGSNKDRTTLTLIGKASMNAWNVQTVLDNVQAKFAGTVGQEYAAAYQNVINNGGTAQQAAQGAGAAILRTYHGTHVSTACTQATREFFDQEFKNS